MLWRAWLHARLNALTATGTSVFVIRSLGHVILCPFPARLPTVIIGDPVVTAADDVLVQVTTTRGKAATLSTPGLSSGVKLFRAFYAKTLNEFVPICIRETAGTAVDPNINNFGMS